MIFQKVLRFTLSSLLPFLIAVCVVKAGQQTDSKNRYVVGNCIFLHISTISVVGMRAHLSTGEFLGSFCTELSLKEIEKKSAKQGLDITAKVKDCILNYAEEDLFQKYLEIGTEILEKNKQHEEQFVEAENSEQPESQLLDLQSLRISPSTDVDDQQKNQDEELEAEKPKLPESQVSDPQSPARVSPSTHVDDQQKTQHEELETKKTKLPESQVSDPQSPARASPSTDVDDQQKSDSLQNPFEEYETGIDVSQSTEIFKKSEFTAFATGLCESTEFVRFEDIEDPKDITDTLVCSEKCISRLFKRIQEVLENLWQTTEAAKIAKSAETRTVGKMPQLPDRFKFIPDCMAAKVSTPQQVTNVAKSYLQKYNDVYFKLHSEYILITDAQMDEILPQAFFDYESCVKWDCSLYNHSDFPLSGWIEENARNPDIKNALFRMLLQKQPEFQNEPSAGDMLKKQLDPSVEVNTSSAQEEVDERTNINKSKVA
ncbi:uncharacterized protein LOC135836929 [Planococcus citri]|uniref:uncharacterized protein LOC135836929 n=1 Tax=Planococcus citri TaxID=170843 RepID=UPI0031F73DEA